MAEKVHRFYEQVVEVECLIACEAILVRPIEFGYFFSEVIVPLQGVILRIHELVFGLRNVAKYGFGVELFFADMVLVHELFHEHNLVIGVVNNKLILKAQKVNVTA